MAEVSLKALTKQEKAAVILLCMDEKTNGQLFNNLNDEEIRRAGTALLKLQNLQAAQIQGVIEEFAQQLTKKSVVKEQKPAAEGEIPIDGRKAAENLIIKTMPKNRGQGILSRLGQAAVVTPSAQKDLAGLISECSAEVLLDLVKEEHPQAIAIALSYAKKRTAKAVLEKLAPEIQSDVVFRMACLNKIGGKVFEDLGNFISDRLTEKITAPEETATTETGAAVLVDKSIEGIAGTIKLLKTIPRDKADKFIEDIEKIDNALGLKLRKLMLTIEDLERADDPGIRELLKNVKNEDLKISLKNAPDAVKERFFKNMSERAVSILKEDMEVMPPIKVEDMEASQANLLEQVSRLIKEEKLKLAEVQDESEEG